MKQCLYTLLALTLGTTTLLGQTTPSTISTTNTTLTSPTTETPQVATNNASDYWLKYVKTDPEKSKTASSATPVKTDFWGLGGGLDFRTLGGSLEFNIFPRASVAFEKLSPSFMGRLGLGFGLSKTSLSNDRILIVTKSPYIYGFQTASFLELFGDAYYRTDDDLFLGVNIGIFNLKDSTFNTSLGGLSLGASIAKRYPLDKTIALFPYAAISYDMYSTFYGGSEKLGSVNGFDGLGFAIGIRSSLSLW